MQMGALSQGRPCHRGREGGRETALSQGEREPYHRERWGGWEPYHRGDGPVSCRAAMTCKPDRGEEGGGAGVGWG